MASQFTTARARLLVVPLLAISFSLLASLPATAAASVPACGHANTDNPGHHYGLIKNGCLPTSVPPSPAPVPTPVPAPVPTPVATHSPGQTVPGQATVPARTTPAAGTPGNQFLPAIAPAITATPGPASHPQVIASTVPATEQSPDFILWLTLALLVAMVAIWLFLIGRATAQAVRKRRMGIGTVAARA